VQRYFTAVDDRRAARSVWTNALLALPSTALFFAVGTALYAFYKARPEALDPTLPTDAVFAQFMVRQLPPGLGGLVVAGLFAAAQPTAGLNSMATAWAVDFAQRKGVAVSLRTGRRATAVAALLCTGLALAMTWMDVASAWDAFLSWLGLAGGLLAGLFALGMLDRRANARGAWVGVAAGVVALYVARAHLGWHFFTYAAVGVVACFGAGALASRIFRSA
jgi:SSS family solute:Na+ symporter